MARRRISREREQGQILVLFVVALVAIIAMVGLVLDGGDAFAQRRLQQNGADLAAMAGADAYFHAYMSSHSVGSATTAAQTAAAAAATRNGFTTGTNGAAISVNVTLLSAGASVQVGIAQPHPNAFARIVGQNSWNVSVDATAISGTINTANGAAPWTMSIEAFNADGSPKYTSANPQDFGDGNGDVPNDALDIAWTDYNGNNNVNTAEVRGIINGSNVVNATFDFDQYLGQHNNGNHTALFGDVDQYLAGHDVAIPIVGPPTAPATTCSGSGYTDGCFKGWAMFHVISAQGGSSKTITGYFQPDGFHASKLTVGDCPQNPVTPAASSRRARSAATPIRLSD